MKKNKTYNLLPRWLNQKMVEQSLTFDEFGVLLILVMNANYGERKFGHVCLSNIEIGKIRGLNRNKVARIKKSLLNKKLITKLGKDHGIDSLKVENFYDFQHKIDWKMRQMLRDIDK